MPRILIIIVMFSLMHCAGHQPQSLRVLEKPSLEYPVAARADSATGTVGMHLYIDKTGQVQIVHVTHSSGNAILDSSAVEYARSLVFKPVEKSDNAEGDWVTWSVRYNLQTDPEYFDTEVYAYRVQQLEKQIRKSDGDQEKYKLELYQKHHKFFDYAKKHSNNNYNFLIAPFIDRSILAQWEPVWNSFPLPHVVWQDFLMLNLSPELQNRSKENCYKAVWWEINRAKQGSNDRRTLSMLYDYLLNSFIERLTPAQRQEIDAFFRSQA